MAGFGLKLSESQGMAGFTGNSNEFAINPTNTSPIFPGDPVIMNASGYIEEATGGADSDDFTIFGIFSGWRDAAPATVKGQMNSGYSPVWTGAAGFTDPRAIVSLPVGSMVRVQGALGGGYSQTNTIGKLFGMDYILGDSTFGESRSVLGSPAAGVATMPLLVHRLAEDPGNGWSSDQPIFIATVVRQQGTYTIA
jgi:hypothetical protein